MKHDRFAKVRIFLNLALGEDNFRYLNIFALKFNAVAIKIMAWGDSKVGL